MQSSKDDELQIVTVAVEEEEMEVEELSSVANMTGMANMNPMQNRLPQDQPGSLRCDICDVTCTSQMMYSQHLGGKKHMKKAKILTEKSEVPPKPGWGQAASVSGLGSNPGDTFGSMVGGHRHTVDNFGKVKIPPPKVDEGAFEDWYAEPIKTMAPSAEKDVSKSRHDFLMSLRGPKTSEKPPIKVVQFDPSRNKIFRPPPPIAANEKPKSATDILRDLQNSGKLPQVTDQLKAQQTQGR